MTSYQCYNEMMLNELMLFEDLLYQLLAAWLEPQLLSWPVASAPLGRRRAA